jgi:hypothetical protein
VPTHGESEGDVGADLDDSRRTLDAVYVFTARVRRSK